MRPFLIFSLLTAALHAVSPAAVPTYEPLATFELGPTEPGRGKLFRHSDGCLYGVSRAGGAGGNGTIYRVTGGGEMTTLASLPPSFSPHKSGLVSDGRGFLWGVNYGGGSENRGVIYKYELATGAFRTVIDFTSSEAVIKGRYPFAGLVSDGSGLLWGTTHQGGTANIGTVFKLHPVSGTLSTVAEFTGSVGAVPGAYPMGTMVGDGAGFLWGTTSQGGANGAGTIFKINVSTGVLTTVAELGNTDGADPESELVADGLGFFWSTARFNGSAFCGTVFKVRMATGELTKVVDFTGNSGAAPGNEPLAGLVRDGAGLLWGTTSIGGAEDGGTLFKINPATGAFTAVLDFPGTSGSELGYFPDATLADDGAGKLLATTRRGGTQDTGTLFQLDPVSSQVTTLRQFTGAADGVGPIAAAAGLSEDASGLLWGTTTGGGPHNYGTIFKVNPGTGALSVVCNFSGTGGPTRGAYPECTLRDDGAGFFWGTTNGGGASNFGTVFKVNIQTGAFTAVADFGGPGAPPGGATGSNPSSELVGDGLGNFWGTTAAGGALQKGTVFKVSALTGNLVTVIDFTGQDGAALGAQPTAGLCADDAGFLWGTTLFGGNQGGFTGGGSVFKVHIGTGAFTSVASFAGPPGSPIGRAPEAGLVPDDAGFLWGTTSGGGLDYEGTVFKVNIATGSLTTVLSFTYPVGAAPGSEPYAGLVSDGAGSFWGTTSNGGPLSRGTIFKISTAGAFTSAFAFSDSAGAAPGAYPVSGYLLHHSDGNLYGVAGSGGIKADGCASGGGQIYRIRLAGTLPPIQGWKFAQLGHPFAPDDADSDQDGLSHLGEYGLLRLPTLPDAAATPVPTLHSYADGRRLRLLLPRDPARSDITLRVEAAGDPAGPWQTVATSALGAPFSGPGYVGGDSATPGVKTVEVRDVMSVSGAPRRFLRMRVSR